ncbi:hypothetical protein TNCV_3875201 [Trichonephila clavipes]|uniref:Uncharacterized protein n=1 Tax=Trichonephila clavipes TaxID=2585209 RepID=A0A8X6VHH9_TRICX|nr:hypothetical protein TNCV_3875201 [Trichonephila clavipes]
MVRKKKRSSNPRKNIALTAKEIESSSSLNKISESHTSKLETMNEIKIKSSRKASTKVFKKRRGVFNKGRCNKSNDGCGESNSTVPKNSADEKNCADGAKLCTN